MFGFEIDFLPVGEKSKSGDAICLRWGYDLSDKFRRQQTVMVVDGGFAENGEDIVSHIEKYYKSDTVDIMVNTHPHADHIGGLDYVLDNMKVGQLLIHQPWVHTSLKKWFDRDGRITNKSIKAHLKEGLESAYSLARKAKDKGVGVLEPFVGCGGSLNGVRVCVLSPSRTFYDSLLPEFAVTPGHQSVIPGVRLEYKNCDVDAYRGALTDEGRTSAENESGVILAFILPEGQVVLLTGDAGMCALNEAIETASIKGVNLENLKFMQVPHHGSIQNVGPMVLDALLGTSITNNNGAAYISVCKNPDDAHPAKAVINAFNERGFGVFMTKGSTIRKHFGMAPGRGWEKLDGIGPFERVQKFEAEE